MFLCIPLSVAFRVHWVFLLDCVFSFGWSFSVLGVCSPPCRSFEVCLRSWRSRCWLWFGLNLLNPFLGLKRVFLWDFNSVFLWGFLLGELQGWGCRWFCFGGTLGYDLGYVGWVLAFSNSNTMAIIMVVFCFCLVSNYPVLVHTTFN
jgi:hypothetical protein